MRQRRCDVVVIGAGSAGINAYRAASARGTEAIIVESGPGGSTCTRDGCMPSKLLIAAGRAAADARNARLFGVDVGTVEIDGAAALARMRAERDRFVQSVLEGYHAIPADRRVQGEARFTGPTTLAVGDDLTIDAGAVIIAVGGHPIVPETLNPVKALVRTHQTIFDIGTLPTAMAVLGAGPLGMELAQAFARLGVAVTVLDRGHDVGQMSDPAVNEAAKEALGREVNLRLGVDVEAEMAGERARLRWTGDTEGEVTVDLVLAATGRSPLLDALQLDKAGVELDDDGVPVFDEVTRRCGDSPIFVVGDSTGKWRPVLHEASRGGRIAGEVAAGGEGSRALPRFAVAFTEPNLVEVGVRFTELPDGAKIGTADMAESGRATIDGHAEGVVRLYGDAAGKLIGAAMAAHGAEHLGHLVALGIDRGVSIAEFEDMAWYHPTVEESLQTAARDLLDQY